MPNRVNDSETPAARFKPRAGEPDKLEEWRQVHRGMAREHAERLGKAIAAKPLRARVLIKLATARPPSLNMLSIPNDDSLSFKHRS